MRKRHFLPFLFLLNICCKNDETVIQTGNVNDVNGNLANQAIFGTTIIVDDFDGDGFDDDSVSILALAASEKDPNELCNLFLDGSFREVDNLVLAKTELIKVKYDSQGSSFKEGDTITGTGELLDFEFFEQAGELRLLNNGLVVEGNLFVRQNGVTMADASGLGEATVSIGNIGENVFSGDVVDLLVFDLSDQGILDIDFDGDGQGDASTVNASFSGHFEAVTACQPLVDTVAGFPSLFAF